MPVYVSGSVAYDRIMDFPGRFSDHILPDKIHILNVCFMIDGLRENFGGTAGNIAYGLSCLGERPLIVSTAGRDFGSYRRWLEGHGLPVDHVKVVDDELTAGAYITTDKSDNQITAFNPGAMNRRTPFDAAAMADSAPLAIVAPGNLEDMHDFALQYSRAGIPYIFDPGQSLPAWDPALLVEAVEGSRILISNDYELEMIHEKTGRGAEELLELTEHLITTRGEEGSEVKALEKGSLKIHHVPPAPPAKVCDPTGAGDAFRAGLIKGLLLPGADLIHAARMGSVSAAYAVEVYGTQTFTFTPVEFNRRFREVFGKDAFPPEA